MKKKILTILQAVLCAVPFICGVIGFNLAGAKYPEWAVFRAIKLYGFDWGPDQAHNGFLMVARITAPIVTGSLIVVLIKRFFERIKYTIISHRPQSCSVYGSGENARLFLENLGWRGIRGDMEKPYKTKYHVVMTDDNESALAFLGRFSDKMRENSRVVLCLNGISPMTLQENWVMSFSLEENCARKYWKENFPKPKEKIALIGTGELFDAMMTKALLLNIIAADQAIEYHLWSDNDNYIRCHSELKNIADSTGDSITYHGSNAIADLELLSEMDRVILCGSENENVILASNLTALAPIKRIDIFSRDQKGTERLFGSHSGISCFGSAKELLTFENVVREELVTTAREVNRYYRKKYGGSRWRELGVFKRKSNISAAEYFHVLRRLHKDGASMDTLSELEHIRWCRFHWLNNWHYGEKRDNDKRIHTDLMPYAELTDECKAKDTENVQLALSKEFEH